MLNGFKGGQCSIKHEKVNALMEENREPTERAFIYQTETRCLITQLHGKRPDLRCAQHHTDERMSS